MSDIIDVDYVAMSEEEKKACRKEAKPRAILERAIEHLKKVNGNHHAIALLTVHLADKRTWTT